MSYVLVGGTFDGLHKGHAHIIETAFGIGGKVLVCLTSDEMVKNKEHSGSIESYDKRKKVLEEFLDKNGWLERSEIVKIEDPFTEGLRPGLTHIVISPGTRRNAEKINEMRTEKGLKPIEIVDTEWVLADDDEPISDVRIRRGDIDSEGHMLKA